MKNLLLLLALSAPLMACNAQRTHDVAVGALGGLIIHDLLTSPN